ncbi:hypothetical protein ALC53_05449 [Atta colombica]|uniref:Endonuclease/exonuclease/phosphatase domain-containing protein n=1 Tax=Atta colombica TaxID=520822 RepID=A0A195BIW9_9HYME|nr:hypothetical protein ALC53_05449 [Atta colombica]
MLKDLINEAGMAAKVSCNPKNNVASVTKSRDYANPDDIGHNSTSTILSKKFSEENPAPSSSLNNQKSDIQVKKLAHLIYETTLTPMLLTSPYQRDTAHKTTALTLYVYDTNREKAIHFTLISTIEIKKIGKERILIEAKTASAANRLVDDPTFSKHNLKAFIPAFRVLRVGVIQDIPLEIDMENLYQSLTKDQLEKQKRVYTREFLRHCSLNLQIINLAATENIPIANAKRIINNNNKWTTINGRFPQNNLRMDFILRLAPLPPHNTDSSRRKPNLQQPNNVGYDRRAHQNALYDSGGRNGYFSTNSLLKSNDILRIKSFEAIRADITQTGYRGIWIRENIKFEFVNLTNVEHIYIYIYYLYNDLADYKHVLIIGDFNAHHYNWAVAPNQAQAHEGD